MTITIHAVTGSPFARAVLTTAIEKRAPYRHAPMAPGAHRSPAHLARQPFGRIPAIEHDGFWLYETQAILRYLDRVFPEPALTPLDPRQAARMDQVMNINDWYVFRTIGIGVVFNRLIAPKIGMASSEDAVAAALPDSRTCVEVLDAMLGDQPYIAGEALTLADLHLGPHLDLFAQTPEGAQMLADTRLLAWLERLRARPSFEITTWDRLAAAA
jgi:glutathione S-transferase